MNRALLALAVAFALAGCVTLSSPAHVPDELLTGSNGNGWSKDLAKSQSAPESSDLGLVSTETLAYVDHGGGQGGGYAGELLLVTVKTLITPSDASLKEQLRSRVVDSAKASGISLGTQSKEGARLLRNGATSTYFVYNGTVSATGSLFRTSHAEVRILGEVWHCRAEGTSALAVGLAQVSDVQTLGGVPISSNFDFTTWHEIEGDTKGGADGQGATIGLVYGALCG